MSGYLHSVPSWIGFWDCGLPTKVALEAAWPDSENISLEAIHNIKAMHAFPGLFMPHKRYMLEFFQNGSDDISRFSNRQWA